MLNFDTDFSGISTQSSIKILYTRAISEGANEESSILYIFSFISTGPRIQSIWRAYHTVLADMQSMEHRTTPIQQKGSAGIQKPDSPTCCIPLHLEALSTQFFRIDRSIPRTSKGWRVAKQDEFEIISEWPSKTDTNINVTNGVKYLPAIYIDHPPEIYTDDPMIQYIGGRAGDYVMFERLEALQVGPMYSTAMAHVKPRRDDMQMEIVEPGTETGEKEGEPRIIGDFPVEVEEGADELERLTENDEFQEDV